MTSARQEIAAILRGEADPSRSLPTAVREITRVRMAVRRALEVESVAEAIGLTKGILSAAARATLPDWAEEAFWREINDYFAPEDPPPPAAPYESRVRSLRQQGYERCPVCCIELPSDWELDRLRAQ